MNQKSPPKQKIIFVLMLFALSFFGIFKMHAQSPPGIALFWNQQVGCQETTFDDKRTIGLDDIESTDCLRVCNQSEVTYELYYFPAGATTTWTINGGTVLASSNDTVTVRWENVGFGTITISVQLQDSTISKTLCIEKIELPSAFFTIATQTEPDFFVTCSQQDVNFINLSNPNNGSALNRYYWDFGDGEFSTVFEPIHTYAHDGNYTVTLTVYNDCNCLAKYQLKVFAKRRGFEISCPTVVCEGQSAIYSLPFNPTNMCSGNLNWSVIGGQIISQGNGNVEVLWNHVDELGFGYVTFNPENCDLECREPTTVKVPVIQSVGTIQGPSELCLKEQGSYKLPQWPTTDIQWEIVGNSSNNLAQIILTDQRNEIIVVPYQSGILTLRAVYTNTLLQCSGQAEFQITVADPLEILGDFSFCQNSSGIFSNSQNASVSYTLTDDTGNVVASTTATTLTHNFIDAGTYTLAVGSPNFCSVDTKTIIVLATPQPPSGVDGPIEVCPSTTYSYSVLNPDANSTYSWVVTNGSVLGSATGEEVNITFNGTFPATVEVTSKTTNPVQCTSLPKIITVNQVLVNAAISSDFGSVCSSSIYSYKAFELGTTTLFSEGDTYTWSLSDPSLGSVTVGQGTTEIEVLWNEVNQVTPVNLILTIGKCTINPAPQFVKSITINPKTEIEITTTQNPVCAGALYPVTYTVSSINGVPLTSADEVTWNLGSGDYTTAPGVFSQDKIFVNNGSTNIDYVVSAIIADANGCGASNKAFFTTTVLPNPPAIATISSLGNAFCTPAEVNTTINVSSNSTGVTFEWYKNGILIPLQNGTSLTVGATLNFGGYSFRATNPNGCIKESNVVNIYQVCVTPQDCTIAANVQNTSSLTNCNTITMSATASPAPISSSWLPPLGTGTGNFSVTGTTLTGVPGVYTLFYKAIYPCQEGGTGAIVKEKQIIIPYAPDFSYITQCNPDNTFNVNFIDNSNFYSGLTTQVVKFYYKTAGAGSFTGPITYDPSLTVFELQNLSAGSYVFKVENTGSLGGTNFVACSKEYPVNLQGVSALTSIIVNDGFSVKCHNSAVAFGLLPLPSTGSTVLWEFGDGATNSALSPSRVYTTSDTTYTVKCTIKNAFGCSIERFASVYIPKECFFGDIIADPADATVCKDEDVLLTYIPNNDNCSALNYIWMNGSSPVPGAANASILLVGAEGSYWVKVSSVDNCVYNAPTKITPTFKKLPSVKIEGQARYCENESIILTAITDATSIVWKIDGAVQPQFNNLPVADFSNMFSPYTFEISCTIIKDGCSNTAYHNLTIEEAIQDVLVDVNIICFPFYHVILTANAVTLGGDPVHFNWSNGASGWSNEPGGNVITVDDGGAFSVTATYGGGCSFTKQIDVPKSPENYMWIFPTGCYTDCIRVGNYLIGPLVPLHNWSWNYNGQSLVAGASYTNPFTLQSSGDYSLTINTGQCDLESDLLSFSADKCPKCKIDAVSIKDVVKNDTPYCSFTQTIVVYNGAGQPFQATLNDPLNNVTLIPSSFTLVPGQNIIQVTVIPNSPFTGGSTSWRIHGQIPDKEGFIDCEYTFPIDIPLCENMQFRAPNGIKSEDTSPTTLKSCTLYPNPANGSVQLQYDLGVVNSTLELYELTGRLLTQQTLSTSQGTIELNISNYATGVYIVVVRNENQIKYQQKLIIK